jgi:hypothetical protein
MQATEGQTRGRMQRSGRQCLNVIGCETDEREREKEREKERERGC